MAVLKMAMSLPFLNQSYKHNNMSINCFLTTSYRGGYIHTCYNETTKKEEIKATYGEFTFYCKTFIGAQRKLTRVSRNPLFN